MNIWIVGENLVKYHYQVKKIFIVTLEEVEEFIKNYNQNDNKGYILEVDIKYLKKLHELHSDLPFLPERMEINKCKKLVCNLYNKKKNVAHINSLKQALNHGLKFKKFIESLNLIKKHG